MTNQQNLKKIREIEEQIKQIKDDFLPEGGII